MPAIDPCQCTTRAIERRLTRRAILKDEAAFNALLAELQAAYTRAWSDQVAAAIVAALDDLAELGPGRFGPEDAASILSALQSELGPDSMQAALRGPVLRVSNGLARLGATEVGFSLGIDLQFLRPDLDALRAIGEGNLFWVGRSWNNYTANVMKRTLDDYFTAGMTREELAARFAEDFAGLSEKGQRYWELLADHTATKTRELGRATGYERAAVEYVEVRAQIDDNTTEICRELHGTIIPVSRLTAQRDEYLAATARRDEEAAKAAWVMLDNPEQVSGGALPAGVGSPPYHFRCRTITVAHFA